MATDTKTIIETSEGVTSITVSPLNRTDLRVLDTDVLGYDLSKPDNVSELMDRLSFMKQEIKRIDKILDDRLYEIMNETRKSIPLAPKRYLYLGVPKKWVVNDDAKLLEDLFVVADGDFASVVECLSSGWAKQGSIKAFFETKGKPELHKVHFKDEGKSELREGKKEVMLMDEHFNR